MITITENAKQKLVGLLQEEKAKYIRFGLQGGGCNGFTYFFAFEDKKEEDDTEFILAEDLALLVDPMSGMYLPGATVDYKKDLMGESFVFNNPNTQTSCGCGNSVGF